MTTRVFFILLILITAAACTTNNKLGQSADELRYSSFSQLDSVLAEEARPVVIFLHASWCSFCRNMEQTTLRDVTIVQTLNSKYYFISLDGEQRGDIKFQGKTYGYQPHGRTNGTHELAALLGTYDDTISYPSLVILNPDLEVVFQQNSFVNSEQMQAVLDAATMSM